MTDKEKAERYDAAIERAKKVLLDCTSEERKVVEYINPELKDSEYEKIRKGIIRCVKGNMPDNDYRKKYIAWLEAHGEQQLNGTFINADEVREEFMQEVYRILDADTTNDMANQIIDAFDNLPSVVYSNQGEQKPANTDFSDLRTWKYIVDAVLTEKEGIGQYLDSPFTEEIAKKLQKRFGNVEQKPTWSEEDETTVHLACEFIRHHSTPIDSIGGIDCPILIKRLKSLKGRTQPSKNGVKKMKKTYTT